MEINNNLSEEVSEKPIDSSQLFYAGQVKVDRSVRLAANKKSASNIQCVCNKMPTLKKISKPHGKGKDKQIEETNPSLFKNMLKI